MCESSTTTIRKPTLTDLQALADKYQVKKVHIFDKDERLYMHFDQGFALPLSFFEDLERATYGVPTTVAGFMGDSGFGVTLDLRDAER